MTFELHKGEWLTITGENGAGKTSLLESILQLIKYKGRMTYNNEELKRLNKQQNTCISCIKNPELQFITNSVYDEVYIHYNHLDPENAEQETIQLLKLLHLDQVKNHHPFEISTGQNAD